MNEQGMTLAEAANRMDPCPVYLPPSSREALQILIGHARTTISETGDPSVEPSREMAREEELRREFRNGWAAGVLYEQAQAHHRRTQNAADEAPIGDPGGDLARRIEPGDGAVCS